MKRIKIGMLGLGTVGSGVYKTLKKFDNIEITKISVKNINKPRNIDGLDESIEYGKWTPGSDSCMSLTKMEFIDGKRNYYRILESL
jgi:homoserine dehydrogenase